LARNLSSRPDLTATTRVATGPLGQPRGLVTLFLTEMWERLSYYGMRSILILYLVSAVRDGGFGFDDRTASAVYGLYIAATYVFALFGGWIADRLLGAQRAILLGGVLIAAGNAVLLLGAGDTFFVGLVVIVLGVGLLKPNISVLVGNLYPEGGARRDAGFSIFYLGISVGALLGSLLVPLIAAAFGWRFGFALPVVGMVFGLSQFLLTRRWLPLQAQASTTPGLVAWMPVLAFVGVVSATIGLALTHRITLDPVRIAAATSWVIALCAVAYFVYLIFFAGLTAAQRARVVVIAVLFAAYAAFYAGFEQGGASMNLFAERYTDRHVLGWIMPAGVLQGTTALITILFAPAFAALWLALGRRGRDPSPPLKFAAGLVLLGLGTLVMMIASRRIMAGAMVAPTWLLLTYLLQEWGDLCLSPVGLSTITKLAPPRFVGQVMGLWFLAIALGNNLAGQLSGEYDATDLASLPHLFAKIAVWSFACAAVILLLTPAMKRLIGRGQ
jgi:POT family proton-dependent oligopeptide transporter